VDLEEIRRVVGGGVSVTEAAALADWYAGLARLVAAFPTEEVDFVEPPLRSLPGPIPQ